MNSIANPVAKRYGKRSGQTENVNFRRHLRSRAAPRRQQASLDQPVPPAGIRYRYAGEARQGIGRSAMTIYLDEDHFGVDRDDIVFPNVQSCMALIVEEDGVAGPRLFGYHMTVSTSANYIRGAAGHLRKQGQKTLRIVCIGNVPAFSQNPEGMRDGNMIFPAGLKGTLSESFDYRGSLLSFNASRLISPKVKLGGATVRAQRQADGPVSYSIGDYTTIAQAAGSADSDIWEITEKEEAS
jgi:hypothetical protein